MYYIGRSQDIHRYYVILTHLLTCKVETKLKINNKQNPSSGKRDNVENFIVPDRLLNPFFLFFLTALNVIINISPARQGGRSRPPLKFYGTSSFS